MKQNKSFSVTLMIMLFSCIDTLQYPPLAACTGITLKTVTGSVICGRTLEFAKQIDSGILYIPRKYQFTGIDPQGTRNGLSWKSTYAVVGANALQYTDIVDGVNEKGLAGGLFYFTDFEYQTVPASEISRCIASWQLLTWLLTTCATIAEVKTKLPEIRVGKAKLPEWGVEVPIHVSLNDATGACMVIEYIGGKLFMYDNQLGVLTNNPSFDWHMTNLRNYVNITPIDTPSLKLTQTTVRATGAGSGMLGIPGDFTPPSRFVRAVFFTQNTVPQQSTDQAVATAFHLLNLFDIPQGSVRTQEQSESPLIEYTQWTSVTDTHQPTYYFHTYNNRQIKKVVLADLTHQNTTLSLPMESESQPIRDITHELQKFPKKG